MGLPVMQSGSHLLLRTSRLSEEKLDFILLNKRAALEGEDEFIVRGR